MDANHVPPIEQTAHGEAAQGEANYISLTESIPLGSCIPNSIKLKIWENQYVDFNSLIEKKNFTKRGSVVSAGADGLLRLHEDTSTAQLSITDWMQAFNVYSTIYLEKYPSKAINLLKYGSTIIEKYKSAPLGTWRIYDESFRRNRQTHHLPWEELNVELSMKAHDRGQRRLEQQPQRPRGFRRPFRSQRAPGTCYDYNDGAKCRTLPCKFPHVCELCKGPHPKIKCTMHQRPALRPSVGITDANKRQQTPKNTTVV